MGRPADAEPILRQAIADFTAAPDYEDRENSILHAMNDLGSCLLDLRRYSEAELVLARTVELKKAKLGPEHVWTLQSITNLAAALLRQDKMNEALPLFREAYEGTRRVSGDDDRLTLEAANNYAFALMKTSHWDDAARIYDFVVDHALSQYPNPQENVTVARFRGNYGDCLGHIGQCDKARQHLMAAYRVMLKKFGAGHVDTQKTIQKLVNHYELCGDDAKADEYRAQLIAPAKPDQRPAKKTP
jgi:tetratricopeptide (TPR) repeat protein